MNGRFLHELTRILDMRGMEKLEGTQLRLVLEGGGESYVLNAEENEAGLLLGLGVALLPHEEADASLLAQAAQVAKNAGLKALRQEGCLYFAVTVPATDGVDALHRGLENCLNCQRHWRRNV